VHDPRRRRRRCDRCHTRYCDQSCQAAAGHRKTCDEIARGGGAEPFYAGAKASEAADVAVAACAAGVPVDATCARCKWPSTEGFVRGCACGGSEGLAHLSCLVREARESVENYEETRRGRGFQKWHTCFRCGHPFHGPVRLALAWTCWKTYLGRPEDDRYRLQAIGLVGNALFACSDDGREQALLVQESYLASIRRLKPDDEEAMVDALSHLGCCLDDLGRHDEALVLKREVHARRVEF